MNYESGLSASDVALLQGRNNNDGFGDGNGWWIVLFLIVLFGGWGNRGFGGFGGNGGTGSTSVYEGYVLNNDFSQLSKQMSDIYNMTDRKLDGLSNGICSLGYQELQNINGVNTNIANGVYSITNAITTNGYETRNAITQDTIANMQNANTLQGAIKDCCCTTQRSLDGVNYNMATNTNAINNTVNSGFVGVQQSMCLNTRDIIDNQNANFRALHDEIVANRIEDKNAQIAAQQNEINSLRLAASQSAQNEYLLNSLRNGCPVNAQLVCGNQPIPVNYIAANGCNCNQGCGCNC